LLILAADRGRAGKSVKPAVVRGHGGTLLKPSPQVDKMTTLDGISRIAQELFGASLILGGIILFWLSFHGLGTALVRVFFGSFHVAFLIR
jgi:hypothetical protein